MGFSNNLKQLRKMHKITQEELANYLHVSRPTIAGYETKDKQPDYDKLIQIASYFDVSVDFLLSDTGIPEKVFVKNDAMDMTKKNIINFINNMDESELKSLNDYIEFLIYRSQKNQ